jgi:hypothetical protein
MMAVAGAMVIVVVMAGVVAVAGVMVMVMVMVMAVAVAGAVAVAMVVVMVVAVAVAKAKAVVVVVAVAGAVAKAMAVVNFFLLERCFQMSNYVIVRTFSAGVFAGYLESRNGREVVLTNARRLWYWAGAASLSQMAMTGTKLPGECKFPIAVDRVLLLEAIEILDCSEAARISIEGVPVWTA